jgi:hypothetical protein
MKLFDLEAGTTIDNVLFEIMLEGRHDRPMREQLTNAIKILGEAKSYEILRSTNGLLSDVDYNIAVERLYAKLREVLNKDFENELWNL